MSTRRKKTDNSVEVFVCDRIGNGARLSRKACGKRYAHLHSAAARPFEKWTASGCLKCPVGRDHAKGLEPTRWPDGSRIVRAKVEAHVGVERLTWKGGHS